MDRLIADPSKAKKELGWQPKVSFEELVEMMVKSDIEFEKKLGLDNGGVLEKNS